MNWEHGPDSNTYEVVTLDGCDMMATVNDSWDFVDTYNETSAKINDLNPSTAYMYAVRALCSSTGPEYSSYSDIICAETGWCH